MAVVVAPKFAKSYNFNPRGSATATVSIASRNPFEGGVPVRMVPPQTMLPLGMYPNNFLPMGEMGDDATPTSMGRSAQSWWGGNGRLAGLGDGDPAVVSGGAPAVASTPSWLDSLVGAVTKLGVSTATTLVDARINKLYGPEVTAVPTTNAAKLPTPAINTLPIGSQVLQAPAASKLPYILIGVGAVGLLAAYMLTRKKRR